MTSKRFETPEKKGGYHDKYIDQKHTQKESNHKKVENGEFQGRERENRWGGNK